MIMIIALFEMVSITIFGGCVIVVFFREKSLLRFTIMGGNYLTVSRNRNVWCVNIPNVKEFMADAHVFVVTYDVIVFLC